MSAPQPAVPGPVRDLLAAIADTLDLPVPAPERTAELAHQGLLDDRVQNVRLAIDAVLNGRAYEGIEWEARYLRDQAAKRPPSYRTRAQFDDDRRAAAAATAPAGPGTRATAAELLAEAAADYAAAEAQRHAGDEPPMDSGLTALAAEAAEATPGLENGPA
ncbi:hypothetical protein [Streptomyces sp. NBC_01314]|uniref:hypothetical protein n=1 Tax=Streptomyces sp. NBC_01314 TaxID=2903821 RepID=UPI00308C205C|nr:hypothetical protein OG622_28500 [Streptomyces sp. NBC_01314]